MSLAVSAVIAPSRRLRTLVAALCALLVAAAVLMGVVLPERFAGGGLLALIPLCAAASLVPRLLAVPVRPWSRRWAGPPVILPGNATRSRVDISGLGQLRLTVQQERDRPATLLPGATVWPACIVLRLHLADGQTRPLVVLPDAVGRGQYRALAVAVRSLARDAAASSSQKID